jgi:hypothetical protein
MCLELTTCPECGAPAEIVERFVLPSTHGPVEHIKLRCVTGPWFTFPASTEWATDNPEVLTSPARRPHGSSL